MKSPKKQAIAGEALGLNPPSPTEKSREAESLPQSEYWWRSVYYADFAKGSKKAPELMANNTDGHWFHEECAAWVYEVVRRHPAAKAKTVNWGERFIWPPFTHLGVLQRTCLEVMVTMELGMRPIVTYPGRGGRPRLPGYSDSIPGYSFDLQADELPLQQAVMEWIERQRQKHGYVKTKGAKKAANSHNERDVPRDCNWKLVELMDHKKGQGEALTCTERTQRSTTVARAVKYLPHVVVALEEGWRGFTEMTKAVQGAFFRSLGPEEQPKPELLEQLLSALTRGRASTPVSKRIEADKFLIKKDELEEIFRQMGGLSFDQAAFNSLFGIK